jgi:toxin ParE1/3/4
MGSTRMRVLSIARQRYSTRRDNPGLGPPFTREIETAIERILGAPDLFRFVEQDVRRCLAHTFPYGVLYTVERDFILIVAVAHGSRKPGYWRERLSRGRPNA